MAFLRLKRPKQAAQAVLDRIKQILLAQIAGMWYNEFRSKRAKGDHTTKMEQPNRIQYYRKKLGLSQEELGEQLFVSRQTVSQWENGQTMPSIDSLTRLRTVFGVSVDDILGLTPEPVEAEEVPEAVPAPVSYEFRYTEDSLRRMNKVRRTGIKAAMVWTLLAAVPAFIWTLEESAMGWVFGLVLAFAIVHIARYRADVKRAREQKAGLLSHIYTYTLTPDGLIVTITDEHDPLSITRRPMGPIRHVRASGPYRILYTADGCYTVDTDELAEDSPIRAALVPATPAASSKSIPVRKHPRAGLQVVSVVLFLLSIASIGLGMMLTGLFAECAGEYDTRFAAYMWALFLVIPIPVASLMFGLWLKRKGFDGRMNIIVGIVLSILLCIFGSFSVSMGDVEDPVTVVETEMAIDIPDYDISSSSSTAGLFGGDLTSWCTIRFTDTNGDRFEAALDAHGQYLTAIPEDLQDVQPESQNEMAFDRCLLFDRDAAVCNTRPAAAADMLALYYDDAYNELTIVLYRWEG